LSCAAKPWLTHRYLTPALNRRFQYLKFRDKAVCDRL
jgi:hypothetical protein